MFDGKDVTTKRPDQITALGVARTFQNIRLFGTMSAVENVLVGQHARLRASVFGSILRTPRVRREEREAQDKARELLDVRRRRQAGASTTPPRTSPTATSAGWRSRARWRRIRSCCCWTSRPPGMNPQESEQLTGLHAQAARRARARDPADRARHEGRDGRLRAGHGARPRREDRRGRAARRCGTTRRSSRPISESRAERWLHCSRSRTSAPPTARSRRSRASRSRSTRARSSR